MKSLNIAALYKGTVYSISNTYYTDSQRHYIRKNHTLFYKWPFKYQNVPYIVVLNNYKGHFQHNQCLHHSHKYLTRWWTNSPICATVLTRFLFWLQFREKLPGKVWLKGELFCRALACSLLLLGTVHEAEHGNVPFFPGKQLLFIM